MWGFLGKMFGSEKALNSIVTGTTSALDKLFYTKEEKAEDAAKNADAARAYKLKAGDQVVAWMTSTQGQNLTRRTLAVGTFVIWAGQRIAGSVLTFIGIWVPNSTKWDAAGKLFAEESSNMNDLMMIVFVFYFSAPYMGDFAKGALLKFGGKKD